jgi:glyoxylase-like metal-dependent hydrolase (beta-lactamase superfamily II)
MKLRFITQGQEFPRLRSNSLLLQEEGCLVLVDCGGIAQTGQIEHILGRYGLAPADIDLVFFTHLHFDHCGNVSGLPRARLAVHWREWEAWQRLWNTPSDKVEEVIRSQYTSIHELYVRFIHRELPLMPIFLQPFIRDPGRLWLLADAERLAPRISAIATPGHTSGHMSLRLETPTPLWLAGDAVVSREAWLQGSGGPAATLMSDPIAQQQTLLQFSRNGGKLVPGHGRPFDLDSGEIFDLDGWMER